MNNIVAQLLMVHLNVHLRFPVFKAGKSEFVEEKNADNKGTI